MKQEARVSSRGDQVSYTDGGNETAFGSVQRLSSQSDQQQVFSANQPGSGFGSPPQMIDQRSEQQKKKDEEDAAMRAHMASQ